MELKQLIKFIKVVRIFLWIFFGFMVLTCIVECLLSLEEHDWHPEGLLWYGWGADMFKLLCSLFLALNLKPIKKTKEVNSNGLQK